MTKLMGQLLITTGALASIFAACAAGVSPQSTSVVIGFSPLLGLPLFGAGLWLLRRARATENEMYVERTAYDAQQLSEHPQPFLGDLKSAGRVRVQLLPLPQQPQYLRAQHYQPSLQIVYAQPPLSKRDQRRLEKTRPDVFAKPLATF